MVHFPLDEAALTALVKIALDEDQAFNDITTNATVPANRQSRVRIVAREHGVIAGIPLAVAAFRALDPTLSVRVESDDGSEVERKTAVLSVSGSARGILAAERVALNFLQRLSGIATYTRRYVDVVRGTPAAILDTRKTTPGWRALEKYAVRCGGGVNHRLDLASAVLIKDNHLAAVDGDVGLAIRRAREHAPPGTPIQIECDSPAQVRAAIAAGAESVLLDNMTIAQLRESVAIASGHAITEASGGVKLSTVRGIAETGVDRISIGALTHSAPAMDLGLDFE